MASFNKNMAKKMSEDSTETSIEHRRAPRTRSLHGAKIIVDNTSIYDCVIKSRSDTGFGLKLGSSHGIPDEFVLVDAKHGEKYDVKVVWRRRTMLGVQKRLSDAA